MAAAADVLTDPDLLRIIFAQIEDPAPTVAAPALARFRALNHLTRDATEADEHQKFFQVLWVGYAVLVTADNSRLATAILADGQHPLTYIRMLHRAQVHLTNRKHTSLRSHFMRDLTFEHGVEGAELPHRMRGMSLSKWVDAQWDAMAPWKRAAYLACHPTETVHTLRLGWRRNTVWFQGCLD